MLNYKKIFALGVAAIAVLVCLAKIRTSELAAASRLSCVGASCASISKANDFSVINILSIKFR